MITKLFEEHFPAVIAQHLLEISNDIKLPKNSINKLCDAVLIREFGVGGKESTAETLMRILDSDNIQCYVYFTGSYY